jgi:hypothetical protein
VYLGSAAPKPYHLPLLRFGIFGDDLIGDQYYEIIFLLITKADLTYPEKGINRGVDMHLVFIIVTADFRQIGVTVMKFHQELFVGDR